MNPPPTFDDPDVLRLIAKEDAEFAAESNPPIPPLESQRHVSDEPLIAFPEEDGAPAEDLPIATLNVMHNGTPALRDFYAGPAYTAT
jgi:hypothetical protein